jgi:hypothetical protein
MALASLLFLSMANFGAEATFFPAYFATSFSTLFDSHGLSFLILQKRTGFPNTDFPKAVGQR